MSFSYTALKKRPALVNIHGWVGIAERIGNEVHVHVRTGTVHRYTAEEWRYQIKVANVGIQPPESVPKYIAYTRAEAQAGLAFAGRLETMFPANTEIISNRIARISGAG